MLTGYAAFVEAFHYVESFKVFFDLAEEISTSLSYADTVAMAEDVVYYSGHALFSREVRGAVELGEEEKDSVVLLVGGGVPGPCA
jgi:hypothetical protein